MVSEDDFRRIASDLPGTIDAPHFDRTAFKVARTYATLAGDGLSANLKLTPDEQDLKCAVAPEIFQPVDNAWGKQGWTRMDLSKADTEDVTSALEMAWRHAQPKPKKRG